jgi:hypothetical protein
MPNSRCTCSKTDFALISHVKRHVQLQHLRSEKRHSAIEKRQDPPDQGARQIDPVLPDCPRNTGVAHKTGNPGTAVREWCGIRTRQRPS